MRFIALTILLFISLKPAYAAEFSGVEVTHTYVIKDQEAADSDILSNTKDGLYRSKVFYDPNVFGVYSKTPVIVFRVLEPGAAPIVKSGVAEVNVIDDNGQIKVGDYVTTSTTAGKGVKALISGYVLGTALEDMTGNSDKIQVAVKPEYAEISNARTLARVLDAFGASFFTNIKDPGELPKILRYIAASLCVIISIIFAFVVFSRSIPKGIEAIGRNPLASPSILLSLGMSILLTLATIGIGILAAVIILRV